MKRVTFRQLRVFTEVARQLSFSRAAESLHLTPPAVTMQVKELENYVGLPLFERQGRQISLTMAGEYFLVHGGASGIGTTAVQLASAFGAHVLATAGTTEKCAAVAKLGAARAINYRTEDFVAAAKEFTGGNGVDLILDMVGGDYFAKGLDALKTGGRIVYIAAQGGGEVALPIFRLMQKRAVVTGSTLRPRDADEKARLTAAVEATVWPWIAAGKLKPVIDRTYPLAEAAKAHAALEAGEVVGKVILTL